jgi:hypothetical protein
MGSDVLPEFSSDESAQMSDIGCGDDNVRNAERRGLAGQNHVSIERLTACSGLSLLPGLSLEVRGAPHRGRVEGQVFK